MSTECRTLRSPDSTGSVPATRRSSVDLPCPFGPTMPRRSFGFTWNETPSRIVSPV